MAEYIDTKRDTGKEAMLEEARERARVASEFWQATYRRGEEDMRFGYGDQWPEQIKIERANDERPILTLNKMGQFIRQIVNDSRQSRASIHCHPEQLSVAGAKIPSINGKSEYTESEIMEGIIRKTEYQSLADSHYDRAIQHAAESGVGWLRVFTEYEPDGFDQVIRIKSIQNRWSVLLDPDGAAELDWSAANYGFMFRRYTHREFQRKYPNKRVGSLSELAEPYRTQWITDKTITVAEYYCRRPAKRRLLLMSDGAKHWHDEVEPVLDEMAASGITIARERDVETHKVYWQKITAWDVLEKEKEILGSTIPIIPVLGYGVEYADHIEYRGVVHDAKDAQRMHNFWMTAATERVALSPKAPWVGTTEMFEGHPEWDDANKRNYSKLEFNAQPDGSRPVREVGATMPAAELQMAMSFTGEIRETLGIYEAALGARSNETSGRAIVARQREADTSTYTFPDNLARAVRRIGLLCVEIIPAIYDSTRAVTIRTEQEVDDEVQLNKVIVDQDTGKEIVVHDISAAKVGVIVKPGISYSSMRQEAADLWLEMARTAPQVATLVLDQVAANMDHPGAQQMAKRFKKALPPNMLTEAEREELTEPNAQPMPPTPEQQAAMAEAEAKIAQAEADKAKAAAELAQAQADLAGIQGGGAPAAPGGETLEAQVRSIVADAIAEFVREATVPPPAAAGIPVQNQ